VVLQQDRAALTEGRSNTVSLLVVDDQVGLVEAAYAVGEQDRVVCEE